MIHSLSHFQHEKLTKKKEKKVWPQKFFWNFELWPSGVGSICIFFKTPLKACSQGQFASLCQFLSTSDQPNPNDKSKRYSCKSEKILACEKFLSSLKKILASLKNSRIVWKNCRVRGLNPMPNMANFGQISSKTVPRAIFGSQYEVENGIFGNFWFQSIKSPYM